MKVLLWTIAILIGTTITVVTATKFYGSELYSNVAKNRDSENVVISPFAVRIAMSAVYVGSNNKTADEIKKGLNLNCPSKEALVDKLYEKLLYMYNCNATLKMANSLIVDNSIPIRRPYKKLVGNFLDTTVVSLPLQNDTTDEVANGINNAVAAGTNDAITKLIDAHEIPEDSRMILASAINFRDDWSLRFDRTNTKKDIFQINEVDSVKVDIMQKEDFLKYGEIEDLDAKVLQLPFKHGNLSMLIILPRQVGGLRQLIGKLGKLKIRRLAKELRMARIRVLLPRFKFGYSLKLKSILKSLGLKRVFTRANFHTMTKKSKNLFLNDLIHKTIIDVDEKGAEVTTPNVLNIATSSRTSPVQFDARRPFVFAIIDKKAEYFIGHVADARAL